MRAHIDISEIESETKIRAKYLRALENEEWDLLPGPTYVKSFLRTYAEALGLDARLLLEEYKLRHERLSDIELQPITPLGRHGGGGRGRRGRGGIPRAYVIWFLVLAALAGIYLLGKSSEDDGTSPSNVPPGGSQQAAPSGGNAKKKKKRKQTPAPRFARLQIIATGPVYVCLKAAGDRTLVNAQTLGAGSRTSTFRSSRFDLTLGNGSAQMKVNGRLLEVPEVKSGIGYRVTVKGRRTLSSDKRPTCP